MYLYADAIEYLMDSVGGGAQDSEHRVLRQAVFHAYRDLVIVRDWRWFETHDRIDISGTYTTHTLPWGVQSVDSFVFTDHEHFNIAGCYVHPRDFQRALDSLDGMNPVHTIWTVSKSETVPDRYDLRVLCEFAYQGNMATLTYRRRPRDLRISGYEANSRAGTVSWQGNIIDRADAKSPTKFTRQMVGAGFRVSDDEKYAPESLSGVTPYVAEGIIYNVLDNGRMYAWSPDGSQSFSSTRYIVSDILDLSPGMYTALLTGAEVWVARLLGKNIEGAYGLYGRDLRLAYESDAVAVLTGREDLCGSGCNWWFIRPGYDGGISTPGTDGTCPLKPDVDGGDADSEVNQEWSGGVFGGTASTKFNDCGGATL